MAYPSDELSDIQKEGARRLIRKIRQRSSSAPKTDWNNISWLQDASTGEREVVSDLQSGPGDSEE